MATEGTVVMVTVPRAMAVGTAARMETVTMTTGMRSPNTVAWGHAAHRQAKREMPPQKTRRLRQNKNWQRAPEGWGHRWPSHLAKVQAREKERRLATSSGVCGFYPVPQGMWKPLAPPGGRYWIPPSRFSICEKFSGTYS